MDSIYRLFFVGIPGIEIEIDYGSCLWHSELASDNLEPRIIFWAVIGCAVGTSRKPNFLLAFSTHSDPEKLPTAIPIKAPNTAKRNSRLRQVNK
jgi:hypothetical protein